MFSYHLISQTVSYTRLQRKPVNKLFLHLYAPHRIPCYKTNHFTEHMSHSSTHINTQNT